MADSTAFDKTMVPPSLTPARPPLAAIVVRDLPLPANVHVHKHLPPHGGPIPTLSPSHPPLYGPSISTSHPPATSRLPKPFMKRSELGTQISGSRDNAPMHSTAGAIPSGLAQPPLSPYVSSKLPLFFSGLTVPFLHLAYLVEQISLYCFNKSLSNNLVKSILIF